MTDIMTMVSTLGFPIAVTLLLMWYINNTQKELIKQIVEISKQIALLVSQVAQVSRKDDEDEK